MEYGQQLGSIENKLKESNKKIEDLAYIIKSLTYSFQEKGSSAINPAVINRMELQLDKISKHTSNEQVALFLQEMKKNLDEKQRFLTSKVGSLEDMVIRLGQYIEKKANELQDKDEISENFRSVKAGLNGFYQEFEGVKRNFAGINSKIDEFAVQNSKIQNIDSFIQELMPFLEKFYGNFEKSFNSVNEKFSALSSLLSKFDPTDEIKSLTTEVELLNVTINTVLSAIQIIDFKYKDIQDSLGKISTTKDIQSLQVNLNDGFERFNSVNEVLKLAAKGSDVDLLKQEIVKMSTNLDAFKQISLQLDKQNKENLEGNLQKFDERIEGIFSLISESKGGTINIAERVNEIFSKFDEFQEILLKLLALDNVDIVKKDINEIFVKITSINEQFSSVSDDFSSVSEKVEQILTIENDDSKIFDIKTTVDNIESNIKTTSKNLEQLSELSKLNEILEKVEKCSETDDIYSIKEILNSLVNQLSKENDNVRGDLFSLKNNLNSYIEQVSSLAKSEDIFKINDVVKNSENNLKTEIHGLGDRFLEYAHKSNEENFGGINQNFENIKQLLISKLADFENVLKTERSEENEQNHQAF
ncbi:MAG: hypothetical protein WC197_03675, partial [Candidatus Gastranaerophilaceae bacterium]